MIPRLAKRAANAAGRGIFLKYLDPKKFVKIESCLRFDALSQLKPETQTKLGAIISLNHATSYFTTVCFLSFSQISAILAIVK
jgi:hypothetical protein